MLGVRPLWVVLRVRVVRLVGQFAPELPQRSAPASFIVFVGVGAHLVVSRDDAGLLLQHAEHEALPLGQQAGPGELGAVQSDPVTVWTLEHRGRAWMNTNGSRKFGLVFLHLYWDAEMRLIGIRSPNLAKIRQLTPQFNTACER